MGRATQLRPATILTSPARLYDDEFRDAAAEDEARGAQARARYAEATRSNLGLGHDIRAGLMDPTDAQLRALTQIVCRLLVRHYREPIAYGAGWTDPERQRPVGDSGRREPAPADAILDAELQRALADPDPLRGIAQLAARWAAAFVLDPAGVTRTKALGSERIERTEHVIERAVLQHQHDDVLDPLETATRCARHRPAPLRRCLDADMNRSGA